MSFWYSLFQNAEYTNHQIADLSEKLEQAESQVKKVYYVGVLQYQFFFEEGLWNFGILYFLIAHNALRLGG